MDITEHRQAEEERIQLLEREQAARIVAEATQRRFALLARVSTVLAASLDYQTVLKHLAQLIVPDLADWCAIDLLDAGSAQSQVVEVYGEPATAQRGREFLRRYPLDRDDLTHPIARAFRTGQPEFALAFPPTLEPSPRDAEYRTLLRSLHINSYMCVPLVSRRGTFGVISFVYADSGRHYEQADLEMAQEIASRAALALDNARLYQEIQLSEEQMRRQTARMQALADASNRLAEVSRDAQAVLDQLSLLAAQVLGDFCIIQLVSDDGQWLYPAAFAHIDPDSQPLLQAMAEIPYQVGEGFMGRVVQTGQPQRIPVINPHEVRAQTKPELWPSLEQLGVYSLVIVPLQVRGRVIGAVGCSRTKPEFPYTADDQVFLQDLTYRAALAIDNARLYTTEQQARQAAERTADRITRLQQVTAALSAVLTPIEVVEVIMQQSMAALGAYACGFTRLTEDGDELEIITAIGYPSDIVEHYRRFPLAIPTPLSDAVRTQELVLVASRDEWDARYPHMAATQARSRTAAAAVIPLVAAGKILGGLGLSFDAPRTFDADDRAFMLAMREQCIQALERSHLYEAEQRARAAAERAAARTARLQSVTAALSEALTPAQVAAVIIEQGVSALDAVGGSVVLPTEDGTALEVIDARGYPPEMLNRWRRFPLDAPVPLSEAVRTATPIWLESRAVRDACYPHLAAAPTQSDHNAWAAIPLVVEGRALGGLGLSFATPRTFDADDRAFMWTLGQQCAQALERARSIEALRRSEERFRVAQELSLDAFTILRSVRDEQGTIVDFTWEYANPAAARVLRRPVVDLVGHRLLDVLPQNKESGLFDRYVRVVETGQPHDIELYYEGEGVTGWFRNMTVKLEDGIAISFSDITSRKRGEEALRFLAEASTQLVASLDYEVTLQRIAHLIVPHMADICVIDLVEHTDSLRRVAAAHVDVAKESLLRESTQYYPPRHSQTSPIWQVLRTGQPRQFSETTDLLMEAYALDAEHLKLMRATGPHRAVLLVPLLARGRTIGVLSCGLIGERRQFAASDVALAEELARRIALAVDNARLYQEAQTAVRMRDQFLSIASHELRNPLTVLIGQTQLLQRRLARDATLSERDQRALQVIVDQSSRLNAMIGTMLDISRMERGQFQITRAPMDLGALTRQVVEELQPTIERHTVECHTPDGPVMIDGDAIRLHQVLQNLVGNAIKYSPHGGQVTVRVEQRGARACVAVTDHGIGIPQDALPQLFQPFYRATKAEGQPISGMGVGLYVVKEIVTLHGGEVTVESQRGHGSRFTILLPLRDNGEGQSDGQIADIPSK